MTRLRFPVGLARRFARSQELRRSTSIVFVVALFIMAMFISLKTLSLSGPQVADRALGRFDASAGYGSVALPPGTDGFSSRLHKRALAAGATDAAVVLSAVDVQLTTTPARDVTMLETDWQSRPFPDRYALLSGRWPDRPGEVVITEPRDVTAATGTVLPVLGGRVKLQVVGTANDIFARTTNLLVAPGTWAGVDTTLTSGFPSLRAQPFLMWSGGAPDAVMAAFTGTAQDWAKRTGATGTDVSTVTATLMTRQDLSLRPEQNWIDRTPGGYTIPSLLLPMGAVLLVFGVNNRRFRRNITSLLSLGVRPFDAVSGLFLAVVAWCLAGAALGALAGIAIGTGARAVLAHLRDRPSGPVDGLAAPTLRLLALIVLASVCGAVALLHERRSVARLPLRPGRIAETRLVRRVRDARQLLAVAAWCTVVVFAGQVDTPARAMMLTGIVTAAVLLVIPDAVRWTLHVLSERGPRRRLARRQLAADSRRAGATLAILTVLLGASMACFTQVSTLVETLDRQTYPDVLPGQVLLADRMSITFPPPPALLKSAEASGVLRGLPRQELVFGFTTDAAGSVTRTATRPGQIGNLLVVQGPAQVEQLVGHRIDPAQAATLTDGGLLVWADAPDSPKDPGARTRLDLRAGDAVLGQTPELPIAAVEVGVADWRVGTDGVLLRPTARMLGLPVGAGPVMVTGVSNEKARALQAAVGRDGLDARAIRIYVPPQPPIPPAALWATAAGLAVLALLATLAATRAQSRSLRGYSASLVAIGIPPAWARHVLLYQLGVLTALSSVLGLVIALLPTTILVLKIPGFVLSIPWGQLLILLAAVYLAIVLAALRSVAALRASEGMHSAT